MSLDLTHGRSKPVPTYDFIDVAQVWFRTPLSEKERRRLKADCGSLLLAQDIRISEPAWWDWSYRQVIRFCQPQEAVQQFLAERDDAHMNYAELARDYILESEEAVIERQQFVQKHFVQRWHRNRPLVVFDNGNYSTGYGKRRGTSFLIYGDQYSKVTGEFPCLHFELKIRGAAALRRMGLTHPRDFLTFNVSSYWTNNLNFLTVNKERLGRWYTNRNERKKRRISDSNDKAIGTLLCRVHAMDEENSFSMQLLIDALGRGPWVQKLPWLDEENTDVYKTAEIRRVGGKKHRRNKEMERVNDMRT